MTLVSNIQTRADLETAVKIVSAVWDNFIKTEPTFVLRDLIVIELAKARETEREECAKIAEQSPDDYGFTGENRRDGLETARSIAAAIRARGQT